jgi:hypothetical protein
MTDIQQQQLGAPPVLPATPAEAATRLTALKSDPAWRDQFLAGNGPQVKEFKNLSELAAKGDNVDMAMAGISEGGQSSDSHAMTEVAKMFRELAIRDEVTSQFLRGEKVTLHEFKLVENWKREQMGDPNFVKRYLEGDLKARQQMTIANTVLVNGVKDVAA